MRIHKIPIMEADFSKNLTDSYGKKFVESPGVFSYVRAITPPNPVHYIPQKRSKNRIVIHGTAGVIKGDIVALTTNKVSTAFVVARDGNIYQLFNPEFCAYHLGPSNDGSYSNTDMSFSSIAIEISNIGPLRLIDGVMYDIYNKAYCGESDASFYDVTEYRGYKYYASYTDEQYDSLNRLINDLCLKYGISKSMLQQDKRCSYSPKDAQGVGISTHVNWRKDKYDLAPNFDFKRIGL